jgi:DNA repair photolyase
MSDLEFLHVTARRILNHVPSMSRMNFAWTINVYRGCSHACTYCLAGETPVLMADGRTKPIADIRPGDRVASAFVRSSVSNRGATLHDLRDTTVLDHWRTLKRGHRVTFADGTALTASADHRFLGPGGWVFVRELAAGDLVAGVGRDEPLAVAGVEDTGLEIPMYDITTGTGDFIANGVVSHNCFARPTHEYLGLNIGTDFDTKIVVKVNAVERLRAELGAPSWAGERIAMGTNTDPYQRAEGKYKLTRGVLEVLAEHANPFSILTKSALVTRDLDVLRAAAATSDVTVNFSIATLDERVWRATEPGTPHPRRRLDAMRQLAEAGIRTGALIAPVLPRLSDAPEQLRGVADAVRAAGGTVLGVLPLHLRPGVREHFLAWLAEYDAELHADYLRRYARGAYAPKHYTERLNAAVR